MKHLASHSDPRLRWSDVGKLDSWRDLMRFAVASVFLLFGLAACAGPGGVSPTPGLMYGVPQPATLVYLVGDTANIDIDAGAMGSFNMRQTGEGTLAMTFAETGGGLEVTASYQDFSARMTNPMGGAQTVSEEDIEGNLVFSIDGQGNATIVTLPEMSAEAESMAAPHALAHEFLPRLPGGVVNPGDTWTDTITYEASLQQGESATTSVMTYTMVGDTAVDGMSLLHVTYTGETEATGSGVSEGMEMFQTFSGDVSGMFLWDSARNCVVMDESRADMSGTVEVPAAGVPPMPMRVTARRVVHLQGS